MNPSMRLPLLVLVVVATSTIPSVATAQYPYPGRNGGGRVSPNGLPQTEGLEPRVDPGPKSEELVELTPVLRGIKLTAAQDTAVRAIRDRFEPQLLPMYDWLRDQLQRKQKGGEVDMAQVQKRYDRAEALRRQELEEVRALLSADQLVRWEKNMGEARERARDEEKRAAAMRERQLQGRPPG